MPKTLTREQKIEKRRRQKRLSMQKARANIYKDPVKHDELKRKRRDQYKENKESGKVKNINDLSARAQRVVRKGWKLRSKKYRDKKKLQKQANDYLDAATPPESPTVSEALIGEDLNDEQQMSSPSSSVRSIQNKKKRYEEVDLSAQFSTPNKTLHSPRSRVSTGKKIARRNRLKLQDDNKKLKVKILEQQRLINQLRVRISRNKAKTEKTKETPSKTVEDDLQNSKVTEVVKKKLHFGEVLVRQIKENFVCQKSDKDKRKLANLLNGPLIQKYKYLSKVRSMTSFNQFRNKEKAKRLNQLRSENLRQLIANFLERDENSRLTAGKKETITKRKQKKQIRLLNDSLKNIYAKFKASFNVPKISYQQFCKCRPFWVVIPTSKMRNTCLCKTHTNMALLVSALKKSNMIEENLPNEVVKGMCCPQAFGEPLKEDCLERRCMQCSGMNINFLHYNDEDMTSVEKWLTKRVEIIVKDKKKICSKTVKETIHCSKVELKDKFMNSIYDYMKHINNMTHQFTAIRQTKQGLSEIEGLLHIDFSENYNCKYGQEIQSAHFGGSKPQISLHTSVFYYRNVSENKIKSVCFCTLSESLRHDPAAICLHIKALVSSVKKLIPNLKTLYFVSDGPSTQYRNKLMFQLMVKYLAKEFELDSLIWNYTESGHGKGAPDGVGGCIKRTADSVVARGSDVSDFKSFASIISTECKGITIKTVDFSLLPIIDKIAQNTKTFVFNGTMSIHQLTWSKSEYTIIHARRLSCLKCSPQEVCEHYELGQIPIVESANVIRKTNNHQKLKVSDIYTSSESESEDNLPLALLEQKKTASANINDYVIVKFTTKKSEKHYVGIVLSISEDEILVKFLRKSGMKFVFPQHDDISLVDISDIVKVLTQPFINNRQQYSFDDSVLSNFQNLC